MKKWLFNPFVYIAGARSLVIGWVIMLITACICMYSHTHFDGVLDAHNGRVTLASMYFIEPFTDWICLVLALYLGGIIFSKSTIRFIDVAGTLALARWRHRHNDPAGHYWGRFCHLDGCFIIQCILCILQYQRRQSRGCFHRRTCCCRGDNQNYFSPVI